MVRAESGGAGRRAEMEGLGYLVYCQAMAILVRNVSERRLQYMKICS